MSVGIKKEFWTLRRILFLALSLMLCTVIACFYYLSRTYLDFAVEKFNQSAGRTLNVLLKQRMDIDYKNTLQNIEQDFTANLDVSNAMLSGQYDKINLFLVRFEQMLARRDISVVSLKVYDTKKKLVASFGDRYSITQLHPLSAILDNEMAGSLDGLGGEYMAYKWNDLSTGRPFHSFFSPIGTIKTLGYVEIVSNPIDIIFKNLAEMAQGSISVQNASGQDVLFSEIFDPSMRHEDKQSIDINVKNSFGENPWVRVTFSRNINDFMREIQRIRNNTIQVFLFASVVFSCLLWLLFYQALITKLKAFTRAIFDISKGHIDAIIPSTGNDETLVMARALRKLRNKVRHVGESERRLRDILANSPIGVVIIANNSGEILFSNERAAQLYDYDRIDFLHQDFYQITNQNYDYFKAREGEKATDTETAFIKQKSKKDNDFSALFETSVFEFEGHEDVLLIWVVDVSDRVNAEEELLRAKEKVDQTQRRLRDAIETLPEGFALWDNRDRLVLSNKHIKTLSHQAPKLFVDGTKFDHLIHEAVASGDVQIPEGMNKDEWIEHRIEAHRMGDYNIEERLPNGKWVRVIEKKTSEGGVVGLIIDITELKRREEDIKTSTQKLRMLVDQTPLIVVEWDLNFKIKNWNTAAEKTFGYEKKQILNHGLDETIYGVDAYHELLDHFQHLMQDHAGIHHICLNHHKDGMGKHIEWYHTPLIGINQSIIGIASLGIDITQRIEFENQLQSRIDHDNLINQISRLFIDHDVETAMNQTLEKLCIFFNCERGYIYETPNTGGDFYRSHSWRTKTAPGMMKHIDTRKYDHYGMVRGRLQNGESVIVNSLKNMKGEGSVILNVLREKGVKSFIFYPLRFEGQLIGLLGLDTVSQEHEWDKENLRVLSIASELIVNALDKRRTQKVLEFTQTRMEQAFQGTRDGIFDINIDKGRVYYSDRLLIMLGYDRDELDVSSGYFLQMIHPDHQEGMKEIIENPHRYHDGWSLEYPVAKANGDYFWVLSRGKLIVDEGPSDESNVYRLVGAYTDISEQRQMTQAIAKQKELLEKTFQSMTEGILVTDVHGNVVSGNKQALDMLLLDPGIVEDGSIIEKDIFAKMLKDVGIFDHVDDDRFDYLFDEIFNKHGAYQNETLLSDGRVLAFQATPMPQQMGSVITIRDVTELRKVDRLKNEFVSTVSHELRTPLTSIRGSLGLIASTESDNLSDNNSKLLKIAQNNCERLVLLINDILDIEKIESGKMDFNRQVHSIKELVQRSIDDNKGFAEKFGVSLSAKLGRKDADIFVDDNRLLQVLTNLISNAVKYSPKGKAVEIKLEHVTNNRHKSTRKTGEKDHIKVSIKDKGAGIPEAFRDKIFSKFAQADSSDTRQKGGTGLGLSISKAIIGEFGGVIDFDTGDDGTCFFFILKKFDKNNQKPKKQEIKNVPDIAKKVLQTSDKKNKKTNDSKKKQQAAYRILHIEDDADIREIIDMNLGDNVQIDYCDSLADFDAKKVKKNDYDMVILDLKLPDGSGVDLVKDLKKLQSEIVVYSAYDISSRELQGIKHIYKKSQINEKSFAEKVKEMLKQ